MDIEDLDGAIAVAEQDNDSDVPDALGYNFCHPEYPQNEKGGKGKK